MVTILMHALDVCNNALLGQPESLFKILKETGDEILEQRLEEIARRADLYEIALSREKNS